MLHIFLLILKILLITVLILIGLVLVLLLLLLFVPVRYRFYAEKHDNFICKLKASWLGFVFCFKANYDENGFVYWLRSFGGTLVSNEDGFSEESQEETTDAVEGNERQGAAVIVIDGGKILCGRRKDDGTICGPGGHVEDGEQPEQAAVREAQEE